MAISYPGNIISATERTTSASSASGLWSLPAHIQKTKAGNWPAVTPAAAAADTYFNLTSLLLHGDGTNGANNTVFVDSSTNALTVTTNGKPYQGTFSPFSQTGWSNYFDGNGDYLSVADNTALEGFDDFTIEGWLYFNSTSDQTIITKGWDASSTFSPYIVLLSSGNLIFYASSTGSSWTVSGQTIISSVQTGRWYHFAISRSGSTYRLFNNGALTTTITSTGTLMTNSASLTIGVTSVGTQPFSGYMSNVRIVKGTAVYTSAFTPSISPLTAITNTQLLTCQDNRFKDNSTNAFTITPNGDASVQPFSPFAPSAAYSSSTVGGSVYFSGASTDYLVGTSSASLAFSGDFTFEGWFYLTGTNNQGSSGEQGIIGSGTTSASKWTVRLQGTSTKIMSWWLNGPANNVTGTTAIKQNTWYHFALVRSGSSTNNVKLYLNGVLESQGTNTYSIPQEQLELGRTYSNLSSEYFNGYVSNIRLLNSVVYNENFTPATSPFTAISNTQFLLSSTNAGIIDSTAKNVITTYGSSANVSTTQSKFGGSSISFGGNAGASCLLLPSTQSIIIPASCDFTVECWVYTPTSSLAPAVWHNVSSQKIVAFYLTDSAVNTLYTIAGTLNYPGSNAAVVRGSSNITANTWTHIAFVRSGSTITVYIDGTSAGTGTSSYATNPLQAIGAISTTTTPNFYFFNGYIDDLRITKYARYTGNFAPTTTAFLDR